MLFRLRSVGALLVDLQVATKWLWRTGQHYVEIITLGCPGVVFTELVAGIPQLEKGEQEELRAPPRAGCGIQETLLSCHPAHPPLLHIQHCPTGVLIEHQMFIGRGPSSGGCILSIRFRHGVNEKK